MKKNRLLLASATAFTLITASACTPTTHMRGNMLEQNQIERITPGVDTPSTVLNKLGSPTTKAPFDDNIWYYIGQETEKRGILDEEVVNEQIIIVTFNQAGTVESIENNDHGRVDTPYVRRKTPTTGNEMTIMQQFMGNLGRFNKGAMNE